MSMFHGYGHIEYENNDITPMNSQKERFLYFRTYLISKGNNLAVTVATLDYLTTHNEDDQRLSSLSSCFMSAVFNNFWAVSIINLYAFFDDSNDMSFKKFFNYIRANWNLIFTGDFYDHIYYQSGEKLTRHITFTRDEIFAAITECENLIAENEPDIALLKTFRDKAFAHFGDTRKVDINADVSIDLLQAILSTVSQIINKLEVLYDRTITSISPLNVTDIDQICYAVAKFFEYRDEIRSFDLQKMNNGIGDIK